MDIDTEKHFNPETGKRELKVIFCNGVCVCGGTKEAMFAVPCKFYSIGVDEDFKMREKCNNPEFNQ